MAVDIETIGSDKYYTIHSGDGAINVTLAKGKTYLNFADRTRAQVLWQVDGDDDRVVDAQDLIDAYVKNGKFVIQYREGADTDLITIPSLAENKEPSIYIKTQGMGDYINVSQLFNHVDFNLGQYDMGNKTYYIKSYTGTAFNDSITTTQTISDVSIRGGYGDDTISGYNHNDKLFGELGNDSLSGNAGNDSLDGGAGNDTIKGGTGNDTIIGGTGTNRIDYAYGDGNDTIVLTKGEKFTLNFTEDIAQADLNFKEDKGNLIITFDKVDPSKGGSITLKGFVNKDITNNGDAKKGIADESEVNIAFAGVVSGDIRDLRLNLGQADKAWTGSWLDEEISANGYEIIDKKTQAPVVWTEKLKGLTLNGGAGDDSITGSQYADNIKGGIGNDTLVGGSGNDSIDGGDGNDTVLGGAGNDTLLGGVGNDTISAGGGNDKLTGGDGADVFEFEWVGTAQSPNVNTITDATNADMIHIIGAASVSYYKNGNNLEIWKVTNDPNIPYDQNNRIIIQNYFSKKPDQRVDSLKLGDSDPTSIQNELSLIIMGSGTITGTNYRDEIIGSYGNDVLKGLAGNDTLIGNQGSNKLYGGDGDDVFVLGDYDDGINTVYSETGNDAIRFEFFDDLDELHQGVTLSQDGTNLKIQYATATGTAEVILDKYLLNEKQGKENSVKYVQTSGGGHQETIDDLIHAFSDDVYRLKRYGKGVNPDVTGGNNADTLTNAKAGYTYMSGKEGNDIYVVNNIANSYTEIDDRGMNYTAGSDHTTAPDNNNTLQIKNVKPSDLAFYYDVCTADNPQTVEPYVELFIIKKSMLSKVMSGMTDKPNGVIEIPEFKTYDINGVLQKGANYIKTIQTVDSKGVVTTIDIEKYMTDSHDAIAAIIAEAHQIDASITSASEVFGSDTVDPAIKAELMNAYMNTPLALDIVGTAGADKYDISEKTVGVSDVLITDNGGKDTYNIMGTKKELFSSVEIEDSGNKITEDSDTYNFTYVDNSEITDNGGNNTFNIKFSEQVTINTLGKNGVSYSSNKYNIINSSDITINDGTMDEVFGWRIFDGSENNDNNGSSGTYNIQSSDGLIFDCYGNDIYNITRQVKDTDVEITDSQGDDNYKIDKLTGRVSIQDFSGDEDILTIGGNQKDFVFMANCSNSLTEGSEGVDYSHSLLIYDKKNGGYVHIIDAFTPDGSSYSDYTGVGQIEEIKIGTKLDDRVFTYVKEDYNEMREEIASWLYQKGYEFVFEVLESDKPEDIAAITSVFTDHNYEGLQLV